MSTLLSLAFLCHAVGILTMAGFGLTYLLRGQFMPYHSTALGKAWSDVPKEVQVLTLALMRSSGAATLALAVLDAAVLLVPFREGAVWALWAIPISGTVLSVGALYAMRTVAANTPAKPPCMLVLLGLGFGILGLALSLAPGAR